MNLDAVTVVGHIERGVDSIFKRPEIKKSSNAYFISELTGEWPEVAEIAKKLSRHEKLTEEDELWINELAGRRRRDGTKTHPLHEHFYEAYLDKKSFDERWEEVIKLFEKAREIVFTKLSQLSS